MRSVIGFLSVSFLLSGAAAAQTTEGACDPSESSPVAELSDAVSAGIESSRDWTIWQVSDSTLVYEQPEALRLPAGVDLSSLPKHPAMGTDLGALVQGRELRVTSVPHSFWWWLPVVTKEYDTNGDGLADLFATMSLSDPTQIASVSIGAPPSARTPRTTYSGEPISRVEVIAADGTRETFASDRYQRVSPEGVSMTMFDYESDGITNSVTMGMHPSSNAPEGWPYVGYHPR